MGVNVNNIKVTINLTRPDDEHCGTVLIVFEYLYLIKL